MTPSVPVQPLSSGADDDVVLVADREWSRAEARSAVLDLYVQWSEEPGFSTAPIVAIDAAPTPLAVLQMWALMDRGIPFVPLHMAWTETQRRAVLAVTDARRLPTAPPRTASHGERVSARQHLDRNAVPDAPLAVVFTSGSTGEPKGVTLSHRAFGTSARSTQRHLGLSAHQVYYLSLPLAHVGGLAIVTRAAVLGGTTVLPAPSVSGRSFDPAAFVERCSKTACSVVSLVPTQLRRICASHLRAPRCVQLVLLGGAHAPASLIRAGLDLDWPIHRTYGLTEACSQVATDAMPGQTGPLRLLPGVSARLEADGRLALRGPTMLSGYWGQPLLDTQDWFVTSDLAELSADGLTPRGRVDDLVISGGENIHPDEIDSALAGAPGVVAACSFGRPSPEWGQELCAVLVTDSAFDPPQLIAHLRVTLPPFKIPKAWHLVTDLPVTATNKLDRRLCQQVYASVCRPFE